jgi:tRNA (mo5U34)-methyltransferase
MNEAVYAGLDITELDRQARTFQSFLAKAKTECEVDGLQWYPYGSLANFTNLARVLTGDNRRLLSLAPSGKVADIGGADGDLGFFLESLGLAVDIVDFGPTNFNGLRGARALAAHLNSSVRIHEVDLDQQFSLPGDDYDLVFFLGILYHLKNPYFAMETLARSARYVVVSTRVAKFAGTQRIEKLPVAYLLAAGEANNDPTNFWIFSETGLARLFDRCGWDVLDWGHMGHDQSNPSDQDRDERVFCLLRSRVPRSALNE